MGQTTSSDNERPQWAAEGARKQKKSNARNSRKNHQTPSPPPPPEFSQQSHNLVPTKRLLIAEDSTGHDYNTLFGEYLDHNVQNILIEEPYLDKQHQLINLLIFIELCVLKCRNLSAIKVLTRHGAEELQSIALPQIKNDLRKNHNILFEVQFSDSMHDREITLDNGYKISLGRGLHFFKKVDTRFGLGFGQYRFRKCQDCKITVFYVN